MVCFSEHYMKSQHLCYAGGQARPFSTGLSVSKSPTAALELKESPPTGQFQPGAAVLEAHTKGKRNGDWYRTVLDE